MEGVLDPILREILTSIGGIDVCVTEFLRVTDRILPEKIFYKHAPELRQNCSTASGTPVLLQLLGGQPGPMAENARLATDLGAHAIDLNFGCPAKTVNRHDGGAALLKKPSRVYDVCRAVRQSVPKSIPVSAKIRLGYENKDNYLDIAQAVENAGLQRLTVHARTKMEGYRPPAHWEYIKQINLNTNIPVVANGEIWTVQDFIRCGEVTGCQEFMLGRGLIADPFLALKCKREIIANEHSQILQRMAEMLQKSEDLFSTNYALGRWKQWCKLLSRNSLEFSGMFEEIKRITVQDLTNGVAHFFRMQYGKSKVQT